MNDELKLALLRIHEGKLEAAKASADWILGTKPVDPFKDEVTLTRMEFANNDPTSLIVLLQAKFDALAKPVASASV